MCGRYALAGDWSDLQREFELDEVPQLEARYNIAPSSSAGFEVPICRSKGQLEQARFWYIPSNWVKPLKDLPTTFNARHETVLTKPFFRHGKRCLVPTSGWREFPGPRGHKNAFHFYRSEAVGQNPFFALAGIYSVWKDPNCDKEILTFSLLTGPPGDLVRPYHHRTPLYVPRQCYPAWLDEETSTEPLLQSIAAFSHNPPLSVRQCSTFGNSTRAAGAQCIAKIKAQGSLF